MWTTAVNLIVEAQFFFSWSTYQLLCIQSCFCHLGYSYILNLHNPQRTAQDLSFRFFFFNKNLFTSSEMTFVNKESTHKPREVGPSTDQTSIFAWAFFNRVSLHASLENTRFKFISQWETQFLVIENDKWQLFVDWKVNETNSSEVGPCLIICPNACSKCPRFETTLQPCQSDEVTIKDSLLSIFRTIIPEKRGRGGMGVPQNQCF